MKIVREGTRPGRKRERERITIEAKQRHPAIPPSGSEATPEPTGKGMKPMSIARRGQEADTSMLQLPANTTDVGHETTEPKNAMDSVRTKSQKRIMPFGMRKVLHSLMSQAKPTRGM